MIFVFLLGTMGPPDSSGNVIKGRGSLYCLERGTLKKHAIDIGISNGLAWNTDSKKMYYIDTLEPVVYQYDYTDYGNISKTTKFDIFYGNSVTNSIVIFLLMFYGILQKTVCR